MRYCVTITELKYPEEWNKRRDTETNLELPLNPLTTGLHKSTLQAQTVVRCTKYAEEARSQ
jgi:hypothetical protein